MKNVAVIFAFLLLSVAIGQAQPSSKYTASQLKTGATVYAQHCSQCHGAQLQGNSAPTLKGSSFERKYPNEKAIYDFASTQMPANNPGSLSKQQYTDVTAFILSKNEKSTGTSSHKVVSASSNQHSVGQNSLGTNTKYETTHSVPAAHEVYAKLPSGANVDVTSKMMVGAGSNDKDWLLDGRTYDNQRYSPLSQITADNIQSLVPVALVQTGVSASFETTPIVSGGVMYLTTPVVNNQMVIMAVNAATGQRLWKDTYSLKPFQICCGPVNRGVALGYGDVYFVTLDDNLAAVDAKNGKTLWQTGIANPSLGYSETMAPQIYDGMVIVGSAGGEWPIRGFVAAYDAKTGKQRWRFWTTDPTSYSGDSWKYGGGMVWTTPAIDPKLGLVIFSTGNPNPDMLGTVRKGDNLYSDSIVALDAKTGQLKWHYQEVKHDVWDYDAVSNVVLFDVNENGNSVPAAAEAGKVGYVFVVDRRNGRLIRKTQAFVKTNKNMFKKPTAAGVDILPGANGGDEWSPPAYSPQTHYMYIPAMDQLMHFTTHQEPAVNGKIRLGSAFTNVKKGSVQDGPFVAVDMETGKVAWTHMTPKPLIGGALATAGNLVFTGEGDGWFDAFDAKTGKRLWRYNLGAGVNAPPISYEVNGTQYIAVAAGGNFQLTYPYGDTLAIFKLASH